MDATQAATANTFNPNLLGTGSETPPPPPPRKVELPDSLARIVLGGLFCLATAPVVILTTDNALNSDPQDDSSKFSPGVPMFIFSSFATFTIGTYLLAKGVSDVARHALGR